MPVTDVPIAWAIDSERQKEKDRQIDKEVKLLAARYSIHIEGSAIVGIPGDTIVYKVQETKADMIVMGRKNRSDKLFGSTVFPTIRKSKIPVLIVPESVDFLVYQHIILATDFDQSNNESCLVPLFDLLKRFHAELHVLHVQKQEEEPVADMVGQEQLGRILSPYSYSYDEITDSEIEHGIQDFIEGHPADLLVVIAHDHSFLSRLFGKDHAKAISRHTSLPLLVLEDKKA
jgi:nucleotide-binding universal stress UspA family protein